MSLFIPLRMRPHAKSSTITVIISEQARSSRSILRCSYMHPAGPANQTEPLHQQPLKRKNLYCNYGRLLRTYSSIFPHHVESYLHSLKFGRLCPSLQTIENEQQLHNFRFPSLGTTISQGVWTRCAVEYSLNTWLNTADGFSKSQSASPYSYQCASPSGPRGRYLERPDLVCATITTYT